MIPARVVISLLVLLATAGCATFGADGSQPESAVSAFQQEILEDGEVSFGEMEFAVAAYAECLDELGIQTEAGYDASNGAYEYSFSTEGADVEQLLEGPDGQECKAEYLGMVELVFADQVGPTPEEDAQFYADVASCMREKGYDVAGSNPAALSALFEQHPDEYLGCFDAVAGL